MPLSWLDMKPECPKSRDPETGRHCGCCYHRNEYACCLCGKVHPNAREVEAMLAAADTPQPPRR